METKVCPRCKVEKQINDFSKDRTKKNNIGTYCLICQRKKSEKNNKENKDYFKTYYKSLPEEKKESRRLKNRLWLQNNKDKRIFYMMNYRNENKDKIFLKHKTYYTNNKEKLLEYNRIRIKNLKLTNPLIKLRHNIASMITNQLKKRGFSKKSNTYQILGCSYQELKLHIESQFQPWMNWDNHGIYNGQLNYGWDIDHIIPLSSAKTEEDIIKLNHHTNLQPLCSYNNRFIKKNKY